MTIENRRRSLRYVFCVLLFLLGANYIAAVEPVELNKLVGQPVDIAPSAYLNRGDRARDQNPPESWIGLIQYAGLPYDKPVNVHTPEIRKVLCGLLWEEVRPVRQIELSWLPGARGQQLPEEIVLRYFDANDGTAHTWWNPRTVKEAEKPEVSTNRRTYRYTIPADTWGVFVAVRTKKDVSGLTVPAIRVFVPEQWKKRDIEIEWGFDDATTKLDYSGRLDVYDGIIGDVGPLPGDSGTAIVDTNSWTSLQKGPGRRGLRLSMLYMSSSRWRRVWPYHAQPEDVARTILTIRTRAPSTGTPSSPPIRSSARAVCSRRTIRASRDTSMSWRIGFFWRIASSLSERTVTTARNTGLPTPAGNISVAWNATPIFTWQRMTCPMLFVRSSMNTPWTSCRGNTPFANTRPAAHQTRFSRKPASWNDSATCW